MQPATDVEINLVWLQLIITVKYVIIKKKKYYWQARYDKVEYCNFHLFIYFHLSLDRINNWKVWV